MKIKIEELSKRFTLPLRLGMSGGIVDAKSYEINDDDEIVYIAHCTNNFLEAKRIIKDMADKMYDAGVHKSNYAEAESFLERASTVEVE